MSNGKRRRESLLSQDFEILASKYNDFQREWKALKKYSSQKSMSSKSTPSFQLALTRALLDFHFNLSLPSMPLDRLCPPVPNRWFYCEWVLSDLIPLISNSDYFSSHADKATNNGLDIGTGASAIYPLLLTNRDSNLTMFASEVDSESIDVAMINVRANGMEKRIHLVKVGGDSMHGPLLQALMHVPSNVRFDFVITNPPFFDQQPTPRKDGRERAPMTTSEGFYPGGEEGWLLDILRDSLTLPRERVGWYSTMIAKKKSWQRLRGILLDFLGPGHVMSTELPSSATVTRWFLAWTYYRPNIQSPLCEDTKLEFEVNLESQSEHDKMQEVEQRIKDYLETFHNNVVQGLELDQSKLLSSLLTYVEKDPVFPDRLMVEKASLPFDTKSCQNTTKDWMPQEGNFCIHFQICSNQNGIIKVEVKGFRHSQRGHDILESILCRLQGEVCRTNRRWRRLLARKLETRN